MSLQLSFRSRFLKSPRAAMFCVRSESLDFNRALLCEKRRRRSSAAVVNRSQ
jgi:hypothetical protein